MESALTNATSQTNFTTLDWVIVVVYLLLSVGIAFFVKRYAGNMTNFVSAGRAVGTWLGIATLTGTEMGLITVMYMAQKGFTSRLRGVPHRGYRRHSGVAHRPDRLHRRATARAQGADDPRVLRETLTAAARASSAASCWHLAVC